MHISSMTLNLPTLHYPQQQISILPIKREKKLREKFQPNIWDYESLQLLNNDHCDEYKCKIQMRVAKVRTMLHNDDADSLSMLELIDKIQRAWQEVALSFRLFRQHGFNVSEDVFKRFMDQEGKFKEGVEEDVKGMLSLYEASHLGLEGEEILVEAIIFTRMNLMSKANMLKMSKGFGARVRHALETPLNHRTQREEARWSIEEACKNSHEEENTKYSMLLELAKLDFIMVQSEHQKDLKYALKQI